MNNFVTELSSRVQKLTTELEIQERFKVEEVTKAKRGLESISEEQIRLLESIVPGLRTVVNYSYEEILKNENGERENIRQVMNDLRDYTEKRLAYYEGQL